MGTSQYSCPYSIGTYDCNLTIIFSKRARISFSDVILEESSSNSEGVDQSPEEECLAMWESCGRSFLLPGIRILENLSNWNKKKIKLRLGKMTYHISRVFFIFPTALHCPTMKWFMKPDKKKKMTIFWPNMLWPDVSELITQWQEYCLAQLINCLSH